MIVQMLQSWTFLLGILFVVGFFVMKKRGSHVSTSLYLGLFAILFSFSSFLDIFWPVLFILFMKQICDGWRKTFLNAICVVYILMAACFKVMALLEIINISKLTFAMVNFIGFTIIMSCIFAIEGIALKKFDGTNILRVGAIIFSIASLSDVAFFYLEKGYDDPTFFIFGIFALQVTYLIYAAERMFTAVDKNVDIEKYKQLAYIDTLTMLPNRTAFDREVTNTENSIDQFKSITCMFFDLNYLKITNDTFGHAAGDELIRGSGYCIQKTFQDFGKSFRLGGDEFAVILYDMTEEQMEGSINTLCDNIEEYNTAHEYKIDISWGIAFEENNYEQTDVRRLLRKADDRMYENKRRMKALL